MKLRRMLALTLVLMTLTTAALAVDDPVCIPSGTKPSRKT